MKFVVFMFLLCAISLFHRREHRLFEKELRTLQERLQTERPEAGRVREMLKGEDWRLCGIGDTRILLRRAFQVKTREDALRYAVPVAILCIVIAWLNAFTMAAVYGAALALKWFVAVTALDLDPFTPRYEVRLFGLRLFGDRLGKKA